ncbi:MAG: Dabb family protein [Simkaniaceae bacterium]|nr:Dabb family protein [Simkaniaceae bacterium]
MIRHVVFYKYRNDISDEVIANIYNELEKISAKLPGRLSYSWGKYDSYEGRNQGFTHCLITDFIDESARNLFLDDEARVLFSKKEVLPRMVGGLEGIISFDFSWH